MSVSKLPGMTDADVIGMERLETRGGTAFPATFQFQTGNLRAVSVQPGMTLRDYFAAHAPAAPSWFMPDMRPAPVKPKPEDFGLEGDEYDPFADDGGPKPKDPDEAEKRVAYRKAMSDYWNDDSDWLREQDRAAFVQWPYRYADLMLAERAKEPGS